jgi:hypothetical protein
MADLAPHYHQPIMSGTGPGESSTNYVPLVAYNGTTAAGGDSLRDNLNIFYEARKHLAQSMRQRW